MSREAKMVLTLMQGCGWGYPELEQALISGELLGWQRTGALELIKIWRG